jgi:hypothetical protein
MPESGVNTIEPQTPISPKVFLDYRLHVVRQKPLYRLLSHFVDDIDSNPRMQLHIHRMGFYFWTANFPIITYLFFFQPVVWMNYGLFITLIYSIYANWTSDYTGMSASQGVINTQDSETDATIH